MESHNRWNKYYEAQGSNPPRAELVEALAFVSSKDTALDLGAGSLRDSVYLLDQGFRHVTAVDSNPSVGEIQKDLSSGLEIIISKFEDFNFPEESFDIINAQYSLPFISHREFENIFLKIKKSLKKGGVFTGQFFGDKDEWKYSRDMNFLTKEESLELVQDMDIIKFTEEEKDEKTAAGVDKHWHIFNMILRRP